MIYAVELYLDKKAEKAVSQLADLLPEERMDPEFRQKKRRFQITLGRFLETEEDKAADRLKKVVRQHKKGRTTLAALGIFSGSLIVSPALSDFLYNLHVDVHEAFRFPGEGFERYAPGNWLPHLPLAEYGTDRPALLDAFSRAAEQFEPISGEFDRVALVRADTDQKEICSFKLRE